MSSSTSTQIGRSVFLVSEQSSDTTCMDIIYSLPPNSLPVIISGRADGTVVTSHGHENLTFDAFARVTQWKVEYSQKHSSKVIGVGILECKPSCLVAISASANDLIFRHLLEPEAVLGYRKNVLHGSRITAFRVFADSCVCIATESGDITIYELEPVKNKNEYALAKKQFLPAASFKYGIPDMKYVGLKAVRTPHSFDKILLVDRGQKIALASPKSLSVFSVLENGTLKVYYEKDVSSLGGIVDVARQTRADYAWLLRDGTITTAISAVRTKVTGLSGLSAMAVFQQNIMFVLGECGAYHLTESSVLFSGQIAGCRKTFGIKEINDCLFVLSSGVPEDLRINPDIVVGNVIISQLIRDNKTFGVPTFPPNLHEIPPKNHVDRVIGVLANWRAAGITLEIPQRHVRQVANECYYLSLALPQIVLGMICNLFDSGLDSGMLDHVIYVFLKCIQGMLRTTTDKTAKHTMARVLTKCYLGQWKHREFVLHLLSVDKEIAKMASEWIQDAIWNMTWSEQLSKLMEKAECL